ncbi:hypothetical protein [Streptomyces sp. NPDC046887]|uniref:hypothetical protein n=1 Tax=Streptomyces sp. NPDC046887 TaxID=3155472 RepID=UPI0033DD4409
MTYAPSGEQCTACRAGIEPFDPVRRATVEREPGRTVAVYRHIGACPSTHAATA